MQPSGALGHHPGESPLDLWRLIAGDPIATVTVIEERHAAPERLRGWVEERLTGLFVEAPDDFVAQMAPAPGAARAVEDVRDLGERVIGPSLA